MKMLRVPFEPPKSNIIWPRREPAKPAMPIPIKFTFGFTGRHPLVPMRAAAMFVNVTMGELLALIEGGELRWTFDIRSRHAARREIRILRQSLFEYAGLCSLPRTSLEKGPELRQIAHLILPEEIIVPAKTSPGWKTVKQRGSARNFQHEMRIVSARYSALKFPKEPVLRATEIAECLSCQPQHVSNLIHDKVFKLIDFPLGPKASPFVTRESVIQFLEQRRLS
ncbi:MAG TPA: hypothetical protein VFB72_19350 [Verrucomicrobiae bacterium]|nr:hypothetical protein [Verrucomicrobiae bacterium]